MLLNEDINEYERLLQLREDDDLTFSEKRRLQQLEESAASDLNEGNDSGGSDYGY